MEAETDPSSPRRAGLIRVAIWLAVATAFAADLLLPLGVAGGVLYVVPVLLSLWLHSGRATLLTALGCSVLTLIGFAASEPQSAAWIVALNRTYGLLAVWGCAVLGWRLVRQHLVLLATQAEIRTLRGLIPICAWCKKIRDDDGFWTQIEAYVGSRTEAEFSHGICPDCYESERTRGAP